MYKNLLLILIWHCLTPSFVIAQQEKMQQPLDRQSDLYNTDTRQILLDHEHEMAAVIQYLSSPQFEGRETGTAGAEMAARYIASEFLQAGIEPFNHAQPGNPVFEDFYQNFIIIRSVNHRLLADSILKDKEETSLYNTEGNSINNPEVHTDTLEGINVIGKLRGTDTTCTIIIGAHYDHLGQRGDTIYFGADDNASGVAGLITLAKYFSQTGRKPPCNILFASWAAEEKGLLGSKYFASQLSADEDIRLYLNMDMISRSAPEDTLNNIVSIGTRKSDEYLRIIAGRLNHESFGNFFEFDLWEVDGHYGSDYAYFRDRSIPVATFFSGFHDDYHSPNDLYSSIDLRKCNKTINFIRLFIEQVMN